MKNTLTRRIVLTGRAVRIQETLWPITHKAQGQQSVLWVRQHADGRRLVYGRTFPVATERREGVLLMREESVGRDLAALRAAVIDVSERLGVPALAAELRAWEREDVVL